jgi:uridine kinase
MAPLSYHCIMIEQDQFFKREADIPVNADGERDWDSPSALDMDAFVKQLQELRRDASKHCEQCLAPQHSAQHKEALLKATELSPSSSSSSSTSSSDCSIPHVHFILVNGFLLYGVDERIADLLDIRLFLKAEVDMLKLRRQDRRYPSEQNGMVADTPTYFERYGMPAYERVYNESALNELCREHGVRLLDASLSVQRLCDAALLIALNDRNKK